MTIPSGALVPDAALVPVIVALVSVAQMIGLPKKWSPLLAVVLGVVAGIFILNPTQIALGVLAGVVTGLAAVGLYSGTKNTKLQIQNLFSRK